MKNQAASNLILVYCLNKIVVLIGFYGNLAIAKLQQASLEIKICRTLFEKLKNDFSNRLKKVSMFEKFSANPKKEGLINDSKRTG